MNIKIAMLLAATCVTSLKSYATDYQTVKTAGGVEYGFLQGKKSGPLLITVTTNIKESMEDVYSPAGAILKANGYSLAAIDAPCHGKDVGEKESAGLECWRKRADSSSQDAFEGYISNLKDVINDIKVKGKANTSDITILGVSRGGYLALKSAGEIDEVSTIIAMAPVTDIFRLREFDQSKAPRQLYGLNKYYPALAKKHIFIQINNNDDRVGSPEAMKFIAGVVAAADPKRADLTAVLTPVKGHSTSDHEMAANWAMHLQNDKDATNANLSAPK